MKKRGSYFFVLDVFIASAILVLTLIIILSSRANSPEPEQSYLLAENYMNFLATTQFRDTASTYKRNLTEQNLIPDSKMTLDQVIGYLYYTGAKNNALPPNWSAIFLEDISQGLIPPQFGLSYSIDHNVIWQRKMPDEFTSGEYFNYSKLVLASKRITFFRVNNTVLIGPMISEVKIWS